MKKSGVLEAALAAAFALPLACTGSIGANPPAAARPAPAPARTTPASSTGRQHRAGTGGAHRSPARRGTTGTVTPCTAGTPPATTRLFRLTHAQYDNTVRALTGLDVHPSDDFPVDQNQAGFDRGIDLQVGDALGQGYRAAAESISAAVVADTRPRSARWSAAIRRPATPAATRSSRRSAAAPSAAR